MRLYPGHGVLAMVTTRSVYSLASVVALCFASTCMDASTQSADLSLPNIVTRAQLRSRNLDRPEAYKIFVGLDADEHFIRLGLGQCAHCDRSHRAGRAGHA